jgi:hypothetical protein
VAGRVSMQKANGYLRLQTGGTQFRLYRKILFTGHKHVIDF